MNCPDIATQRSTVLSWEVCESILFLIYQNLRTIQKAKELGELQLSGGLSQLNLMCQKLADLTVLQVKRLNQQESTIRGIASGQPENWSVSEYDRFQPKTDMKLKSRFHLFIEQLGGYIEGASNG
ncbi:MAG: hypothetical protein GY814_14950 [Gammaproteobacteria bacterium]|nr:hypothetical protein [Gammaproteobacteria bacterium]